MHFEHGKILNASFYTHITAPNILYIKNIVRAGLYIFITQFLYQILDKRRTDKSLIRWGNEYLKFSKSAICQTGRSQLCKDAPGQTDGEPGAWAMGGKTKQEFTWHPAAHHERGKESLYFLRLAFSPVYDRAENIKALNEVMNKYEVLSFEIYELTGHYDLLFRFWLPTRFTLDSFYERLRDRLRPLHLHECETFHVTKITTHWVWCKSPTDELPAPDLDLLRHHLPDEIIEKANNNELSQKEWNLYEQYQIFSRFRRKAGIKFIVVIPMPNLPVTLDGLRAFQSKIQSILREARGIYDVSMYFGEGFGQFLIMGCATPRDFSNINTYVIGPINQIGREAFFGIRTFTHVILNQKGRPLIFRDQLPATAQVLAGDQVTIEEVLLGGETETLEIKGSAFTNLERWALGDGKREFSGEVTHKGVLKAAVGLLNARGGKVIIGALEKDKYQKSEILRDEKKYPRYHEYIICGADVDYVKKGWDKFELKLQDTLDARIEPSASIWLTVKKEILFGKELCVISVREPFQDEWFYLKEGRERKFFVRQGNRTKELTGMEADYYKRTHRRSITTDGSL